MGASQGSGPVRGVNLGNWLVLEKWMSPRLFAGTEAEDETQLSTDLAPELLRERLRVHRDTYVTERDFAFLAHHGVQAVRIPVPHFVFGDREPHLGCLEHLDRAVEWAGRHGLDVLLDLHTVPGGQNGFDNSGLSGVCTWHQQPEEVEFALTVLERLTARYRDHPALWGIEVLNEPISQELWDLVDVPHRYPARDPEQARASEPVPTDFLQRFYVEAHRRIRAQSVDVTVVFHDGFRLREWSSFFTDAGFDRFAVDTHLYLMVHTMSTGDETLAGHLAAVRGFADEVAEASERFPLIVGEWCLDPMAPSVAALDEEGRRRFHRALADAQLAAWEPSTGWFFWTAKLLLDGHARDGWDLGTSLAKGYLPPSLTAPGRG